MPLTKAAFLEARHFMKVDVEREIALARVNNKGQLKVPGLPAGGGNFLVALGLLCYTEFAGSLLTTGSGAGKRFNAFFDELGPRYKAFRKQHNVYGDLRCGLAHEYFVKKKSCTINMLRGHSPIGIAHTGNHYTFNVEAYWHDFERALDRLHASLFP